MFYRGLLTKSWKTTWENKYLWFFGLFAALVAGGGELEIIRRGANGEIDEGFFGSIKAFLATGVFSKQGLIGMKVLMMEEPLTFFVLISLFLAVVFLVVFVLWLGTVSQVAIVDNSYRDRIGKKHDFTTSLDVGIKKFFPAFALNAGYKVLSYFIFVIVGLSVLGGVAGGYMGSATLLLLVSYLVFIPLIVISSFIVKYALAFVVVKDMKVIESVQMAFEMFRRNWLLTVEVALLAFFINFVAALVLLMCLVITTVPFLFVMMVFSKLVVLFNFWFVVISGGLLYFTLIIVAGSILSVFQVSLWTNLFAELLGKGGESKLNRMFAKK